MMEAYAEIDSAGISTCFRTTHGCFIAKPSPRCPKKKGKKRKERKKEIEKKMRKKIRRERSQMEKKKESMCKRRIVHIREESLPPIPLYDEVNLQTQIEKFPCSGINKMRIHNITQLNGTFEVTLDVMLNSEMSGKWTYTATKKEHAIQGVCFQCLAHLSTTSKFSHHFTNDIMNPGFSILNSIC